MTAKRTKQFGHAFLTHGQKISINSLRDRANSSGESDEQGKWLNDNLAAQILAPYRGNTGSPITVDIPTGLGIIILKDRKLEPLPATKAIIVFNTYPGKNGQNCLNTAYPIK